MDDIKRFNDKIMAFLLLTVMMVVFIPSTSSKYVKEYSLVYNLSTKLAQFRLIWTDQTGSNAPAVQTVAKGDGFSGDGYYLLVAKGGNGDSIKGPDDEIYEGGYGGIVAGIFKLNSSEVTFEVALGTSADGKTGGANPKGALTGGNSPSTATTGGSTAGGAGTMLLVKNDSYNSTSNNNTAVVNKLVLLAGGGGGSGAYTTKVDSSPTQGFCGGNGGSDFISPTTQKSTTLGVSSFLEFYGNAGAGAGTLYGAGGNYAKSTASYSGTQLTRGLTGGMGGVDSASDKTYTGGNAQALGAGGGGGFGGGATVDTFAGGAGGGSSAINTTSSITNVAYQSSYSAARILEIYKEKMAEMISLDTNTNSSGQRISDLCVMGNEGYLYNKNDTNTYSDISFVAIYYLGTTAP